MNPYVRGKITKQAHVGIPDGLCEEEYGRRGFFGRYAHLYRSSPPLAWSRIEGNLKPRSFSCHDLPIDNKGDFLKNRIQCLYNDDLSIFFANIDRRMSYYFRNADGDELYFIHKGKGVISTDFGNITYKKGDYIIIPKGCVYIIDPEDSTKALIIESKAELGFPEKGLLGHTALFDPCMIDVPDLETPPIEPYAVDKEFCLVVKSHNELTRIYYPHCPLNTIGWKGTLSVMRINVADIRPIMSERYHLPPSAHTTFLSDKFVVCSFLPRPLEVGDPTALKVPFYHANVDFDEVLFYHDGDFFSRDGIDAGMITLHPQGIHHGPHKNAIKNSKDLVRTEEIAVMIDTRNSLKLSNQVKDIENLDYWKSWR